MFGPHPRDHRLDMPKRMRHLAMKCVLSEKARRGRLILVEDISVETASTKSMIQILASLGADSSTLILTDEPKQSMVRSARNLKNVWTLPVSLLNAEQLLRRDLVIMTVDAARRAEALWAEETPRRKKRTPLPGAQEDPA